MASEIKVDTISEKTSANGITIDGVNIKDSALATAGSVPLSTIDIDGGTDIGAAIVDADLFIIDDGAGGTNRKTTASRLKTYIGGSDPASADGDSLGTASLEWSDLYLADGGQILFGNDQDVLLTHVADTGLTIKTGNSTDDRPVILTLANAELLLTTDEVIGKIQWQAPDEASGTDAILVSAAIQAVAEGAHSASSNATRLEFMTGASEAATAKMKLSSAGDLTVTSGNIVMSTSGKGIDFSATADGTTMSSELLDDYEEGTWTPAMVSGATMTAGTVAGFYTKIGNRVFCNGRYVSSDLNGASGAITLTGLPFTSSSTSNAFGWGAPTYAVGLNITAGHAFTIRVETGGTVCYLALWDVTTGTSNMTAAEWSDDGDMRFGFSYMV